MGHAYCIFRTAYCYWDGFGCPKDEPKAMAMFEEAEARGIPSASWYLATTNLRDGNIVEAAHHFRIGTELGDPDCLARLEQLSLDEVGFPCIGADVPCARKTHFSCRHR